MEDCEIILLYHSRSETAIEQTASKYGTYCFTVANNILKDFSDSEECVNDTWLRAWQSIPPHTPDNLKLFLAKITRNLAFNKYKSDRRKKRGGGETEAVLDELAEFVSGASEVETEMEIKELQSLLNLFLRTVGERDSAVFIQRYFFVESTGHIAQKYGISTGNVLKILSRTRVRLKKYLEREGYAI